MASWIMGAIMGVLCIIGASKRAGGLSGNELFLLAMWYNRLVMGLVVGLASGLRLIDGPLNRYLRAVILGFMVSLAIFLSTAMRDVPALFAGPVFAVAIEYVAKRYE
jgi:hypothetical protein